MHIYSRHRSSYDGKDVLVPTSWTPDEGAGWSSQFHSHLWTHFQDIWDDKNPKVNGKYLDGWVHNVHSTALQATQVKDWRSDHYQGTGSWKSWPPVTPATLESWLGDLPAAILLEHQLKAWEKFSTQVPEVVSIANFLYELKDFQPLLKKLRRPSQEIKAVKKNRKSVGYNVSIANSTFLQYNFAWAPMISDLQKMITIMDRVTSRLDFLRRNRGKPVPVRYFAEDIWDRPIGQLETFYIRSSEPLNDFRYALTSYQVDFRANCMLLQDLKGVDEAWGHWKAIFAALGLNNPAKILWNAIPFSFLVDWLVPVNGWLSTFGARPFDGLWEVYSVNSSIRERMDVSITARFEPNVNGEYPVGKYRIVRYRRRPNLGGFGLPGFKDLSLYKQMLFTSLSYGLTTKGKR